MCKQGTFISNMIFVRQGLAKIYLEDRGHPVMLNLAGPGYFIGLPSLFDKGVYHYTVEALADTDVCLVNVSVFRELLRSNAEFATEVLRMVNQKLVNSYNRLSCVTNKQIHGRFAGMLLNLSHNVFKANPFEMAISKKDMADIIYSSQESISRLLKEFKQEGLISQDGNTIELLDVSKLEKISYLG